MKRYFSSFMGMKESENGEWVEYPIFKLLQEKCLANDDLAKSRLETIHERNEEIITLKQELDTLENENTMLEKVCNDYYDKIDKLLKENKPNNLYLDLFSTSLTFNILFLMIIVYCFVK